MLADVFTKALSCETFEKIQKYHDLVKQLSYYLYFFSFLFLLDLLHKEGVQESVTRHNVTGK